MDPLTFIWLSLLTTVVILTGIIYYNLYKTSENTRLEAMALRARLNAMSDKGNPMRATRRNHSIPVAPRVELDFSQFEMVDKNWEPPL